MEFRHTVIIKMLLTMCKCLLITGILHFLLTLLVADKHPCHNCHLHCKGVITLCCMLIFIPQVVHCGINVQEERYKITYGYLCLCVQVVGLI